MTAEIKDGKLIITLDVKDTPTKKEGGKLNMIATTAGFKEAVTPTGTTLEVGGKVLKINAMAGFPD